MSASFAASRPWASCGPFVIKPRTAFLDDLLLEGEIEQRAGRRDAFVIHDVELGFRERGRDFVLHDFDAGAIARHDTVGLLDRADAADVARGRWRRI